MRLVSERNSWQSKCLNILLRIFLKPQIKKFATEKNLLRLTKRIQQVRKKTTYYFKLPKDAKINSVLINGLHGKWINVSAKAKTTILYLHGGAYAIGSSDTYLEFGYQLAKSTAANIFIIDYRLAPEYPYPCALEDALLAYEWLCTVVNSEQIIIAGDSAGGGLALSALIALRDGNKKLPAGAVCLSPWTDAALTGASITENANNDCCIIAPQQLAYLGNINPLNPLLSPLYADLSGLPPILIQVSNIEILLDDSRRFAQKAIEMGTGVHLEVWKNMPHCWPLLAKILPEGRQAIMHIKEFIHSVTA